jgi:hypothetical protein
VQKILAWGTNGRVLERFAHLVVALMTTGTVLSTHPAAAPHVRAPKPAVLQLPVRVELWGDSMGMQSAPAFEALLAGSGHAVAANHTFPGTAICDWLGDMRNEVDPANPAGFHPQAAVLVFSGISYTGCMRDSHGAQLTAAALVDKYRSDAAAAIAIFAKAHVPVYFASVPISRDNAAAGIVGDTPLGRMYATLPQLHFGGIARFIDAARAVERNGHYTDTLPCQKGETCTGYWPDGTPTVVVREADGKHFCPVAEVPTGDQWGLLTCPVVMPGAVRYMRAITTKVLSDFGLA